MMVYRRERPKIRKILEELMEDYGWSAYELYEFTGYDYDDDMECTHVFSLSQGMRIQLRKMVEEEHLGGFLNDKM
jgi:hypothetical protein